MTNKCDVIVIGGGHNGLVNAAYLASAGKRVLVLKRPHVLGGACVNFTGAWVNLPFNTLTAETQRAQRGRRELQN